MATSSKSTEKTTKSYPVRQRIQSAKAVENILNWVGNDDTHFSDKSMRNIYCTGTLMSNHKGFPKEIKSLNIKHLESEYQRNGNGILLCA